VANIKVKDHDANARYLKATGAGTDLDPHVTEHESVQGTHDDLNCNANLQVGDADVGGGNPVPVSDAGGSLTVDNAALAVVGGGAEASALRVTLASDSTGVVSVDDNGGSITIDGAVTVGDGGTALEVQGDAAEDAAAAGNPILAGGRYDATPRTLDDGDVGALALDADGALQVSDGGDSLTVDNAALAVVGGGVEASALRVTLASDSTGVVSVDDNGGSLTVDGTVAVSQAPATSGGYTIYRDIDLDETGISVKGSAGQIYGWFMHNKAASTLYVKFYNSSGAPTVGTDTPILTIPIPAGASANVEFLGGIACSSGIGIGCTTGVADNDTGAPGANEMIVNVFYK